MAAHILENRLLDNDARESMPMCDDNHHEETKSEEQEERHANVKSNQQK